VKAVLGNRVALGVKFNGDDFLPSEDGRWPTAAGSLPSRKPKRAIIST